MPTIPTQPSTAQARDRGGPLIGLRLTALRKARGLSQPPSAPPSASPSSRSRNTSAAETASAPGGCRPSPASSKCRSRPSSRTQGDELSGEPAEVFGFLREPGAIDLLRIYAAIPDEGLRREIVALVRSTARLNRAPPPRRRSAPDVRSGETAASRRALRPRRPRVRRLSDGSIGTIARRAAPALPASVSASTHLAAR